MPLVSTPPLEVFLTGPERKNWLVRWTEVGAEKVGTIQSLMPTCVPPGVDPYACLVDAVRRIAIHPQLEIADLTPRVSKGKFDTPAMPLPELSG